MTPYHSQHTIISLPTIYSSSPLCFLPFLAPDITLSTLLSVSPKYKVLHPCVTFHFWPQIYLSDPYYQSPHNIQFFTPMLRSSFRNRYHSQYPIISLPTMYSSSPLRYLPLWTKISHSAPYYESPHNIKFFIPVLHSLLSPDIILSTLLWVYPQYTVFNSCVTFKFWPQISLSAPYYQSAHNIQFFTPLLPYNFGPRYHSQHSIMSLPTI